MAMLNVSLFGEFRATVAGQSVGFPTDKVRALLAYLALESDQLHRRETLAGLLWGEWPHEDALSNLRKSLHRLQETVDRFAPSLSSQLFTTTRQALQLNQDYLDLDIAHFRTLLAATTAHSHQQLHLCQECLGSLTQAAALYRGELLAGFGLGDAPAFEEWLLMQREVFQHQMLETLYRLATAYLQRGEYKPAQVFAARRAAMDPLNEEGYRQLMRILALDGQRSAALVQYENCRRLLAKELGVEPQQETVALYQQIRTAVSIQELGIGAGAVPRLPRLDIPLHHFPSHFTPFTGRDTELAQVQAKLLDPDCRLLSIIGPGGVGKTRLSLEAVRRFVSAFTTHTIDADLHPLAPVDGVYFVGVDAVAAAELLPAAIAAGLGLPFRERDDPKAQLLDFLRSKRCFLVIDNFEHLVDAAPFLADILGAAPNVRFLVTSRRLLNLQAEHWLPIGGLDYPVSQTIPDDPLAYSAVRLFFQACRQIRPEFKLSPDNVSQVIHICQLVEGLPLAVEIAAAWVRVFDCATIATTISHDLTLMETSLQGLPARHRSLQAVFLNSWKMLSPTEKMTLGRLSVFRGRFTLEAVLSISQASIKDVAGLLDIFLLRRVDEGWYELHELMRQFAADRLADMSQSMDTGDTTLERHSRYYLNLIREKAGGLAGTDAPKVTVYLQRQVDNIRQAWQWALHNTYWQILAHSAESLALLYNHTGLFQEGLDVFSRAVTQTQAYLETTPTSAHEASSLLSQLRTWRAFFLDKHGHLEEAIKEAQKAISLAEWEQDAERQAQAQSLLGELLPFKVEFGRSRDLQQQALAYYRTTDDTYHLAQCLGRLGVTYWRGGDYPLALDCFQQAIPLFKQLGNQLDTAKIWSSMAGIFWEEGNLEQAQAYIRQAAQLYQSLGDKLGSAYSVGRLSIIHRELGDFDLALEYNQQAIDVFQELGYQEGLAHFLGNRGNVLIGKGEFDQGLACYQHALQIDEAMGHSGDVARHLGSIGYILRVKGNHDQALSLFDRAIPLLRIVGSPYLLFEPLLNKAMVLRDRREFAAARVAGEEALQLAQKTGRKKLILESQIVVAEITAAEGDRDGARQPLESLLATSTDSLEQATLHWGLWRVGQNANHARAAIIQFRQIYEKNPDYVYKERLEELLAVYPEV